MKSIWVPVCLLLFVLLAGVGCRKQNGGNGPTQAPPSRPAAGGAAPAAETAEQRPADAVARVGDLYVSKGELEARIQSLTAGRQLEVAGQERLRRRALDELVERCLVELAAKGAGIEVSEEELDQMVAASATGRGGAEGHARFLEKQAMTQEDWRAENRFTALRKKLRDERFPVALSDDEIQAYYEKYADAGNKGEKVRVSRIFLPVDPKAAEEQWKEAEMALSTVRAEIEAGLAFDEAARRSSKCAYAKKGGDMGFATHARRPEDVFAPAFEMKVGEIAGPMRVSKGVQLLKVTERTEEKAGTFEQEKENIRSVLEGQARQRNTRKLVDQLQKQYRVEYYL